MDNYFTSPKLCIDLHQRKINAYGTVRCNRKEMPPNFSLKHLRLKRGGTVSRVRGNLRAVCWKDKQEVFVLANMPIPPPEGNFKEGGKAVKPLIVEDYTTHMGYVDLNERMQTAAALARKPGNGQKNSSICWT
jgi:hypothetical protein